MDPTSEYPHDHEINLRDILRVIKKRKHAVLTFAFITIAVVLLGTLAVTPLYLADVQVLIERNYENDLLDKGSVPYDPGFLNTQVNIIQCRNVVNRVVKKLNLDSKYRHYFLKDDKQSFRLSLLSWLSETMNSILFARDKGEDGDQLNQAEPTSDNDRITAIIQENLTAKPLRGTKIVEINYMDENPVLAGLIANTVAEAYMDEMLEIRMNASNYAIQWMASKAQEEKEALQASERALQKYTREHDIVTVENKMAVIPQKLTEFSTQLSKAQVTRSELEDVYNQILEAGDNLAALESIPLFTANSTLQSLRDQILKAEQHISELSKKYGPKHPLMIKAVSDWDVLIREKENEIYRIVETNKNDYELARSRENNIKALLNETKQDLLNLKERFTQYDILKRDVETNRVLYDALMTRIKQQSASKQSQSVNIWVVKNAETPTAPAKPRKILNMSLALVLGIFGGLGMAFLLEFLDNTVKSPEEIELRTGLPVLGVIQKLGKKEQDIDTLVRDAPKSLVAENYRSMRSLVMLSSADQPPKSILITSATPSEGKSSTVANFARTLAMTQKSVLIIDCDMRKPRLHRIFGVANSTGLSNFLTGTCDTAPIVDLPLENLNLIASGPVPPNPSELLASNRMRKLLAEMSDRYDFIILDSPPVMGVTDGHILGTLTDGTILVVRAGYATWEQLKLSAKLFNDVKAPLLGVVLNDAKPDKGSSYFYQGYYYYEEPGEDSEDSPT